MILWKDDYIKIRIARKSTFQKGQRFYCIEEQKVLSIARVLCITNFEESFLSEMLRTVQYTIEFSIKIEIIQFINKFVLIDYFNKFV